MRPTTFDCRFVRINVYRLSATSFSSFWMLALQAHDIYCTKRACTVGSDLRLAPNQITNSRYHTHTETHARALTNKLSYYPPIDLTDRFCQHEWHRFQKPGGLPGEVHSGGGAEGGQTHPLRTLRGVSIWVFHVQPSHEGLA